MTIGDGVLRIYPTAMKVEAVLRARAHAGDVSLGHRVTTFPELVEALDRDVPGAIPVIPDALAAALFREVLAAALPRSDTDGLRAGAGLATETMRLLGELKAAGLGAVELAAIGADTREPRARERLALLGRIAAAYGGMLDRVGRADRHDRERRVLALLADAEVAGTRPRALLGVTRVVIAEIYDYSLLQCLIVTALIRVVGDAELITLAHPENVDATRFVERTWNHFVEDPAIADKVLPDFVVRGGRRGALAHVLAGLFVEPKPAGPPPAPDASIAILAAPSRYAEVEAVGRQVAALLTSGMPAARIAILMRDLATYRELVEDVARRYRLPVAFRRGRSLLAYGMVRQILHVVRTAVDGLPREALVDCLRAGAHRDAGEMAALLATIGYRDRRTASVEQCLTRTETRLGAAAVGAPAERARRAGADLTRLRRHAPLLAAMSRRLAGLDTARSFAEHAAAVCDVVAALGLDALPEDAVALGRDGAAGAAFFALLDDLGTLATALDGTRPITLATFFARVLAAAEALEVDEIGVHASNVRALAIPDARGLDFDAVFVLGLDDGSFPAPRREHPLLDDGLRALVNRHAPPLLRRALGPAAADAPLTCVLRGSVELHAEDPFLFYLALSTAEEQIVLSYPTHDHEGHPLVRSPYVDEVLTLVPWAAPPPMGASPLVPEAAVCLERGELLNRAVLDATRGAPQLLAALGAGGHEALAALVERIAVERRRARYFLLDPERDGEAKADLADSFVGRVPATAALQARLRATTWSATAFEELGACGFKFFARRLLYLAADAAPGAELSNQEAGRLVHLLLERLVAAVTTWPDDAEAAAALARRRADEWRAEVAAGLPPMDEELFALAWERAVEQVAEFARDEVENGPAPTPGLRTLKRLEWPFRFTIADHRAVAADERLDLTVGGTLDRADLVLDEAGRVSAATVLDYKNGKQAAEYAARLEATRAMGTTAFQIPVYALALRAHADPPWAATADVAGGYVLLRAARKRVVRPLAASLLALDPAARRDFAADDPARPLANRIIELVAHAAAGRFDVDPTLCDPWCDYRHLCRYQPPPVEEE